MGATRHGCAHGGGPDQTRAGARSGGVVRRGRKRFWQAVGNGAREARKARQGRLDPDRGAKEELLPIRGAFESSVMDSEVVLVAGSVDVFAVSAGGGGRWLLCASAGVGGGARRPAGSGALADGGGSAGAATLRRYCAANRLNRFATLTYARSCRDPRQLRADVAGFFRGLRSELGGEALPYAWTSEWHPGGHGLHVHFAVGRCVRQRLIRDVWARGIVHIKLIADLPQGSGALEEARVAAAYLAKYVSKSLDDERRGAGLHRYEVAQGFQPQRLRLWARGEAQLLAKACELMGAKPSRVWRSSRRMVGLARRRAGLPGHADITPDVLRGWVEASCAAQGVAVVVTDVAVLARWRCCWGRRAGRRPGAHPATCCCAQTRQTGRKRLGSNPLNPRRPAPTTRWSRTAATIAC